MIPSVHIKELYVDDLVYKFNSQDQIVFGTVLNTYEASDSDDDFLPILKRGQILVLWNSYTRKQVCQRSKVRLMCRAICPGDIVRRLVDGQETQRGYCRKSRQLATVQIVDTNKVIEHVPWYRLPSVKWFDIGDAICLDTKFGRIQAVHQLLRLQASCGSIVEIRSSINSKHVRDRWMDNVNGGYYEPCYPGQIVACTPMYLKDPKWIKKSKIMKRRMDQPQKFVIQSAKYTSLEVWWCIAKGHTEYCALNEDEIKNVKVLSEYTDLQICDRNLLQLQSTDILIRKDEWLRRKSSLYRPEEVSPSKSDEKVPKNTQSRESLSSVGNSQNVSTDNTPGNGTDPMEISTVPDYDTSYISQCQLNDDEQNTSIAHDNDESRWWTEEELDDEGEHSDGTGKTNGISTNGNTGTSTDAKLIKYKRKFKVLQKFAPGAVLPVDILCTECNVDIVWQDGTVENAIPSTELYFSVSLDQHEFFPGEWIALETPADGKLLPSSSTTTAENIINSCDTNNEKQGLVVHCSTALGVIQKVDNLQRTAEVKLFHLNDQGALVVDHIPYKTEVSVYELKKYPKFIFQPGRVVNSVPLEPNKMGCVMDIHPEGYVIVKWVDGKVEKRWPHTIAPLPDCEDFDFSDIDDSISEDDTDDDDDIDDTIDVDDDDDDYDNDDDDDDDELERTVEGQADEQATTNSVNSGSWETESVQSCDGVDVTTGNVQLERMATEVDYMRQQLAVFRNAIRSTLKFSDSKHFHLLKNLMYIYDNCRYLDTVLNTAFFNLDSKHFQFLLEEVRQLAETSGVVLKGRLFQKGPLLSNSTTLTNPTPSNSAVKVKGASEKSLRRIIHIEGMIRFSESLQSLTLDADLMAPPTTNAASAMDVTPPTPEMIEKQSTLSQEVLYMLKLRLDLVYAEILSRLGRRDALTLLSTSHTCLTIAPSVVESSPPSIIPPPLPTISTVQRNDEKLHPALPPPLVPPTECFAILDEETAPSAHYYYHYRFVPDNALAFLNALKKEYKLLRDSLPSGVWVRTYTARTDLLSVMIRGPAKTPYEDGLFLFDMQLSTNYPRTPPLVHFISYISEGLNPNLYVEGRVCVSLLGTWRGRGSEVWGLNSNLLQLIVSIQGLILNAEPYYNEAGYEKQTHTQQGGENSRTYNELVVLKLVQSMTELLKQIPTVFQPEIVSHFTLNGTAMCRRLRSYVSGSIRPDFPLLPVSRGLQLSFETAIAKFEATLEEKVLLRQRQSTTLDFSTNATQALIAIIESFASK